jgi:hypothetical protein
MRLLIYNQVLEKPYVMQFDSGAPFGKYVYCKSDDVRVLSSK